MYVGINIWFTEPVLILPLTIVAFKELFFPWFYFFLLLNLLSNSHLHLRCKLTCNVQKGKKGKRYSIEIRCLQLSIICKSWKTDNMS